MRLNRHDQDVAWRELARRFGVSEDVARALLVRAQSDAHGDTKKLEWNFRRLLAETQGIDVLESGLDAAEASTADIGKCTRVLFENQQVPASASPAAQSPADLLKNALERALQQGEQAWKSIVSGNPREVIAALDKLRNGDMGKALGIIDSDQLAQIVRLADALVTIVEQVKPAANGKQLPGHLQSALSERLGDISDVRIHDDGAASEQANRYGAIAFAEGTDVFFADGAYDPSSTKGQELIAHEVAHVAQQRNNGKASRGATTTPGDRAEREADRFAGAFARGAMPGHEAFRINERAAAGTISRRTTGDASTVDPSGADQNPKEWKPKLFGQILDLSAKLAGAHDMGGGWKIIDLNQSFGPLMVTFAKYKQDGAKITQGEIHAKINQGSFSGTEGTLQVDADGKVNGQLTVPVTVSRVFEQPVQLTIDSEKITGTTTLTAASWKSEDFPIESSSLTLAVTFDGHIFNVAATGFVEVKMENGIAGGKARLDILQLNVTNSGITFEAKIEGHLDIKGLASADVKIDYDGQNITFQAGSEVNINIPGLQGKANIAYAAGKISLTSDDLHITLPKFEGLHFKNVKAENSKLEGKLELVDPVHVDIPGGNGASFDIDHSSIEIAQGVNAGDLKGKFNTGASLGNVQGEVDVAYQKDGGFTGHVTLTGGADFTVGGVHIKLDSASTFTVDRQMGLTGDVLGSVEIPGLPKFNVHVVAAPNTPIDLTCDATIPLARINPNLSGSMKVEYHRGGGANAFSFEGENIGVNAPPYIDHQVLFEAFDGAIAGGQFTGSLTAKAGAQIHYQTSVITLTGGTITLGADKKLDGHFTASADAGGGAAKIDAVVGWKHGEFDWSADGVIDLNPITQGKVNGKVHASGGTGNAGTFETEGDVTFTAPALQGIRIVSITGNRNTQTFHFHVDPSQFAQRYLDQLPQVDVRLDTAPVIIDVQGAQVSVSAELTGHATFPRGANPPKIAGNFHLKYDADGFKGNLSEVEVHASEYFNSTGGSADLNDGGVHLGSGDFVIQNVASGHITTADINVRSGHFALDFDVDLHVPILEGVKLNVNMTNDQITGSLRENAPTIPIGSWATLQMQAGTTVHLDGPTGLTVHAAGAVAAPSIGQGTFSIDYCSKGATTARVDVTANAFALFRQTEINLKMNEQRQVSTTRPEGIVLMLAPEYEGQIEADAKLQIANNDITVTGEITAIHGLGPLDNGFEGAHIRYNNHVVTIDGKLDAARADSTDFQAPSELTMTYSSASKELKLEGTLKPAKIGPVTFDESSHIHAVWTNKTKKLQVDGTCHGTLPEVGTVDFTVDSSLGGGQPGHFGLKGHIDATQLSDKLAPLQFSSITSDFTLMVGGGAAPNLDISVRGGVSGIQGIPGPVTGAIEAHYRTGTGLGGSITLTQAKLGDVNLTGNVVFESSKFVSANLTAEANFPGVSVKGALDVHAGANGLRDLSATATLTVTPGGESALAQFIENGTLRAEFHAWKLTGVTGEINLRPPPMLPLDKTKITVGWDEGQGLHAELSAEFPAPLAKNGEKGTFVVGYSRAKGLFATVDFPIKVPGFDDSAHVHGELNSQGLSLSATLTPKFPFIKSATVTAGYHFGTGFFIEGSVVVAPTESMEFTISVRYEGGKLKIGGIDSNEKNADAAQHEIAGFDLPFPPIPLATVGVASLNLQFGMHVGAGYRMPKVKFNNPQLIGGLDALDSGHMPGFTFGGEISMGAYIAMSLSVQIVGEIQLLIASCSAGIGAEITARLNLDLGAKMDGEYKPGEGAKFNITPSVAASLDLIAALICTLKAKVCWFTIVDKKWTLAQAQFAHIDLGTFAPFDPIAFTAGGPNGTTLDNGLHLRDHWWDSIKSGVEDGATHAGDEEANKDAIDHVRPVLQSFKRAAPQFDQLPEGWEKGMTAAPVNFKQMFPVEDKDWDFYQDHADQAEKLDPSDAMHTPSEKLAKAVAVTAKRDPAGAGRLILAWRRAQIANKGIDPDNGVNVVQEREVVQQEIQQKYQKDLKEAQDKQKAQDEEWQQHVKKQEADFAKAQAEHTKVGADQNKAHDQQTKKTETEFTDAQTKKVDAAKKATKEGAKVDAKKEEKAPPPAPPPPPPALKPLAKPAPIPKPPPVPLPPPPEQLPAVTLPALPPEPGGMATAAAVIPPSQEQAKPESPGRKDPPAGAAPDPAPGTPSSAQQQGGGGGSPMPNGGSSSGGGKPSSGGVTSSAPPPGPAVKAGPDGIISQHKTLDAKKAQVEGKDPNAAGAKPGFLGGLFGGGAKPPAANGNAAPPGAAPAGAAPAGAAPAGDGKAPAGDGKAAAGPGGGGALDPTVQAVVEQGKTEEKTQKETLHQQDEQLSTKVKAEDAKAAEETKQLDKDAEEAKKKKEEEAKAKAAADAKAEADKKAAADKKDAGKDGKDGKDKPKGPIGSRIPIGVLGEAHTLFINEAGVPMVASDEQPVTAALDKFTQAIGAEHTIKPLGASDAAAAKTQATKLAATSAKAAQGDQNALNSVAGEQQALVNPLKRTWAWDRITESAEVKAGMLEDWTKHPYYNEFLGRVTRLSTEGHIDVNGAQFAPDMWKRINEAVNKAMPAMNDPEIYDKNLKNRINMESQPYKDAIHTLESVATELAKVSSAQFSKAQNFGFWSTPEGKSLAEKTCDLTLETSGIGGLMDGIPTLNANAMHWDPQIWGALSKAYATKMVPELVKGKKINVCIGGNVEPGNIWEKVESVALSKGLEHFDMSLESVTTHYGAAAKCKDKKKRGELDLTKNGGGKPGTVFAGKDRAAAVAAVNAYFNALPETIEDGADPKDPKKDKPNPDNKAPVTTPTTDTKPKDQVGTKTSMDVLGESHTLYIDPKKGPHVASTPTPLPDKLAELTTGINAAPADLKKHATADLTSAKSSAPAVTDLSTKAMAGDATANQALAAQQAQLAEPLKRTWSWLKVSKSEAVTSGSLEDPLKHPYYTTQFKVRVDQLSAKGHITGVEPGPFAESTWKKICEAVKKAQPQMNDPKAYSNFAEGWLNMQSPEFQKAIKDFEKVGQELAKAASSQFAKAKTFGFWSKDEGRALAEASTDLSLETSAIGSLMDGLPTLDGKKAGWDPEVWGALSHAYASAVVPEVIKGKKINVCVGAGVPPGNIWEAVESVALSKGLEKAGISLDSVTTYFAAAAKSKADRKALDETKNVGGRKGCLFQGDRGGAIAAANTHFNALPEAPKKDDKPPPPPTKKDDKPPVNTAATPTPAPTDKKTDKTPATTTTSVATTPTPTVDDKKKPDAKAVEEAEAKIKLALKACATMPHGLSTMSPESRIELSTKLAPAIRQQFFPDWESMVPAMDALTKVKVDQLATETGFAPGEKDKLVHDFKDQVTTTWRAEGNDFIKTMQGISRASFGYKGKPLSVDDFNAAAPNDDSLSRAIGTHQIEGAVDTEAVVDDYIKETGDAKTPSKDVLVAHAMVKIKANATTYIKKYTKGPELVRWPGWVFPEPSIKHDAVFSEYCDLLALYANWYPQGHIRMTLKRPALLEKVKAGGLKKPTVFDGMMSPLWVQRDNRDHNWGKTGGGLREAMIKVDWEDVDQNKWKCVEIDPKYKQVLEAHKRADAADKAKEKDPSKPGADDKDKAQVKKHEDEKLKDAQGAQAGQKKEDSEALSKHAAGPAPSGWEGKVVGKVPSTDVVADDPGHTYHLLTDGSVVTTSVTNKGAADLEEPVAKKLGKPAKKELRKPNPADPDEVKAYADWVQVKDTYNGKYHGEAWYQQYKGDAAKNVPKQVYKGETDRWSNLDGPTKRPPKQFLGTDTPKWTAELVYNFLAGPDATSTFKAFATMLLKKEYNFAPNVTAIHAHINNITFLEKDEDHVRHGVKEIYKDRIIDKILLKPTPEEQHKMLLAITGEIDSSDKGGITERYYQRCVLKQDQATADKTAHVGAKKDEVTGEDGNIIEIERDRFIDIINGKIGHEIKSTDSKLSGHDTSQMADNALMVQQRAKLMIKDRNANGTAKKTGTPFVLEHVQYTLTSPDGARANFDVIIKAFNDHGTAISFEVFDDNHTRLPLIVNVSQLKTRKDLAWMQPGAKKKK